MRTLLLVGGGGFLGSMARYLLSGVVTQSSHASRFPWGTLVVNLVGCLAIGAVAGAAEQRHILTAESRAFLLTGVLGGFTTFSAFAYESYFLGREQLWFAAAANVTLQVMLGLGAVWLGHRLVLV